MRTFIRSAILLLIIIFLCAFTFVFFDFYKNRDIFPPNTSIGNIEVSYLTTAEALAKLKSAGVGQVYTPLISLEADTLECALPPETLGIRVLYEETVANAFNLVHGQNYFDGLKERLSGKINHLPLVLSVDKNVLSTYLQALAEEVASTPKDASIQFYEETGGYNIEAEELGEKLEVQKSMGAIVAAIYKGEQSIPLVIDYSYPRITENDLRAHPPVYRLSAYTTYYGRHDSPNRIHNIKLIASWVNNTILMPGDKLSLADTIGEFTPERGFKEAFVILSGELVPEYGGGTCQIGTTFYNAVALADLKVLQRRNHSFYFNIYPLGRDATVYPGQVDFKFENDSGFPLLIKTIATNRKLSFRIYGTPNGKTVKFSSPSILGLGPNGYVPMSLRQVIAQDIPFKTTVIRTVYDKEGNKIKEETIHSSYKLYGEKTNVPIRRPEPR